MQNVEITYTEKFARPFVPASAIEVGDVIDFAGTVEAIDEFEHNGTTYRRFSGSAVLGDLGPVALIAALDEPVILPFER